MKTSMPAAAESTVAGLVAAAAVGMLVGLFLLLGVMASGSAIAHGRVRP